MTDDAADIPDDLIGLAEACRLLPGKRPGKHMSLSALWRWTETGRLRCWRVGRLRFVRRQDVLAQAQRGGLPPVLREEAQASGDHQRAVADLERWGLSVG